MSERARKLLNEAMDLSLRERAELADSLLASLHEAPDEGLEVAWAREVEKRAKAALENPEDDISWESVRAELHAIPSR